MRRRCRLFLTGRRQSKSRGGRMTFSPKNAPSGRIASLPSQHCLCRTPMRQPRNCSAASTISASSARSSTASARRAMARRRFITICHNIARSGVKSKSSTCLSTCIRAIRCRRIRASMTAIPGCSAPPGLSRRKRRSMRCVSWPQACLTNIRASTSFSAIWARACLT
ncbi:hypothetical protein D3C86_1759350 [compost metagenome]